jgi:hypothetical protein
MTHLTHNLLEALVHCLFDHRPNVQARPDLQRCPTTPRRSFHLVTKGAFDAVGVSRPAIGADQHRAGRLRARSHLQQQPIRQLAITSTTHHPTQPQARRDHYRQSHPRHHAARFHPDLVGLHVDQIELSLLDNGLMYALTLFASAVAPGSHRPFIQSIGLHNRLHRASKGQKRDDNDYQLPCGTQSLKHGAAASAEGVLADPTTIALSLAIVDRDIALSNLASCATRQIRAKLL